MPSQVFSSNTLQMNKLKLSGALYFLAGSLALMGIITAEAMYPSGYSTFSNEISDLGSTKQPNIVIHQPSASIFNLTMLLAGLMSLIASFYQHKYFKRFLFTVPILLFSLGLVGVGLFPGNMSPYHGMSSLLAFLSGGFAAIFSNKILCAPYKYFAIAISFSICCISFRLSISTSAYRAFIYIYYFLIFSSTTIQASER